MPRPLYVIDAFTDRPFAGNPAAVCLLDDWPAEDWLQNVGREMNLSETAFLVPRQERGQFEYDIRWFTPTVEVDLCGHATLAAAHALDEMGHGPLGGRQVLVLNSKSGPLMVSRVALGNFELDFPADPPAPVEPPPGLFAALGTDGVYVGRGTNDLLVEVATEAAVRDLAPDFRALARAKCRGVIVTAKSDDPRFDFVSRFFAPDAGINEDPVTGSAHCTLAEFWGPRLGKAEMVGFQASARGGVVRVARRGHRVGLGGRAVTVTRGTLEV